VFYTLILFLYRAEYEICIVLLTSSVRKPHRNAQQISEKFIKQIGIKGLSAISRGARVPTNDVTETKFGNSLEYTVERYDKITVADPELDLEGYFVAPNMSALSLNLCPNSQMLFM